MKKNKKWLAVVLAVVMALSSLSVAFTAFAAATPDDIDAMNAKLAAATASDPDLNAELKAMGEDKDLLDPWYLMRYYNEVTKTFNSDTSKVEKAQVENVLGFTKNMEAYIKLYSEINFYAFGGWADSEAKLKAADKTQVTYFLLGVKTNKFFGQSTPITDALPNGLISQAVGGWPTSDNWAKVKALDVIPEWFVNNIDAVDEINQLNIAFNKGELTAAEYVEKAEGIKIHAYTKSLGNTAPFDTYFTDGTNELSINAVLDIYQTTLNDTKFKIFKTELAKIDLEKAGSDAFNKTVEAAVLAYINLPDAMKGTALYQTDPDAYKILKAAQAAYTGDKTMPNLHESFDKQVYAGSALVGNTVDSAVAALSDLLPQVLKDLLGTDKDLKSFLESQFTNYNVTYLLATVSNLINDLLGGIDLGGMTLSLTVEETVNLLAGDYPKAAAALGQRGPSTPGEPAQWVCLTHSFMGTEADVMNHVSEQMAAGVWDCYPTEASPAKPDVPGEFIYKTWNDVLAAMDSNPALYDWGITEGNFESFIDALLAGLRPLTGVLNIVIKLANEVNVVDGNMVTSYNIYENVVIPLLEMLGATDVMSSNEYTTQFELANAEKGNVDSQFKPIFMQLYDKVIVPLMENPVDYLLNNLPNIVYHLEDGCVTGALLDVIAGLGLGLENDPTVSKITSFKSIVDLIYGLIANGDATKELTAEQQATADKIYTLITDLAKTGTPTVVPTAAAKAQNTIKVVADRDNMVNYLANALPEMFGINLDFAVKGEFVKSEAPVYPHDGKMGKDVMNTMIDGLDGLLSGLININDLINNGLCTNVMAADAITGIYNALGSIDLSALGLGSQLVPPSAVAAAMNEDIYKEVAADLTVSSDNWSDVVLVLRNDGKVIDNTDMGFEDGDRDGFINCLTAALRPLLKAVSPALVNGTLSDGTTNYGLYETIILPLFEDIGLTPAATSAEYTDNFNRLAKRSDPNGAYDYLLKTVLAPVLDLVDSLAAAPAKTLFTVLPNLAYAIYYNPDIAFLGNLLDSMGGLTGLLNGLIQGIETGKDANGNAIYGLANFVLPEIPLNALASAGTVTEKQSKAALRETYNVVVADTADAFVTTFYYLYDAINYKDNMKVISDLIAGIDGIDPSIGAMVGTILSDVFTQSKEEALCSLGSLLASDVWSCPDGEGNNGNGTPGTGDYSISAVAVLAVMFTAGAAIMVLRKKKVTE